MYRLIDKIPNIIKFNITEGVFLMNRRGPDSNERIRYVAADENMNEIATIGDFSYLSNIVLNDMLYVSTLGAQNTYRVETKTFKIIDELEIGLSFLNRGVNIKTSVFIGGTNTDKLVKYNLSTHVWEELGSFDHYLFYYWIGDNIIEVNRNQGWARCRTADYHTILWDVDLSAEGMYKDFVSRERKGHIQTIRQYKNSVLLVAGSVMARYDLSTGERLWALQNDKNAFGNGLVIDGHQCYVTGNAGYRVVDLEKGIFAEDMATFYLSERDKVIRLKDIIYDGKKYAPAGVTITGLHDGLLWNSITDSKAHFIVAIDVNSGHVDPSFRPY